MVPSVAPMYYLIELLVFYRGFVYYVLCRHFSCRGASVFNYTIALFDGACDTVDGLDFFVVFFF